MKRNSMGRIMLANLTLLLLSFLPLVASASESCDERLEFAALDSHALRLLLYSSLLENGLEGVNKKLVIASARGDALVGRDLVIMVTPSLAEKYEGIAYDSLPIAASLESECVDCSESAKSFFRASARWEFVVNLNGAASN